jgi:four helix bundle protein
MEAYRRIEDLVIYQKLCRLDIEIRKLTHRWLAEEKYELGSQTRRSSNSASPSGFPEP